MPLFDVYIAVDFSGSAHRAEQQRNIVLAEWERSVSPHVENNLTRSQVTLHLLQRVIYHNSRGKRVLCGFDFQYSFPQGFWHALTGLPESWTNILQGISEELDDLPPITEEPKSNARQWANMANHRIAKLLGMSGGPFWGPNFYQATDPHFQFLHAPFEEFRLVEKCVRGSKPIFKIGGQGAVGLQSLCGMPHLFRFRARCAQEHVELHCWPFDGWNPSSSTHVLVEWYPAIQNQGRKSHKEDASACVRWAKIHDEEGKLLNYFIPHLSNSEKAQACVEGWVLGACKQ